MLSLWRAELRPPADVALSRIAAAAPPAAKYSPSGIAQSVDSPSDAFDSPPSLLSRRLRCADCTAAMVRLKLAWLDARHQAARCSLIAPLVVRGAGAPHRIFGSPEHLLANVA
eukprot:scaffold45512_cov31-Tisochrysis_lutea.AAC.2